jgi:membrane fusion protein, heavy metal efflux system
VQFEACGYGIPGTYAVSIKRYVPLFRSGADAAKDQFAVRRVQVVNRLDGKVLVRCSSIPKDDQVTAAEAGQGLLPKEPLRPGERVLVFGGSQPVKDRLGTLERKLDQVLEELAAQRRSQSPKP